MSAQTRQKKLRRAQDTARRQDTLGKLGAPVTATAHDIWQRADLIVQQARGGGFLRTEPDPPRSLSKVPLTPSKP